MAAGSPSLWMKSAIAADKAVLPVGDSLALPGGLRGPSLELDARLRVAETP